MTKRQIFIIGSGRSGTATLAKLLGLSHEYLCTHVQPIAVKYQLGLVGDDEATESLYRLHGRAVGLSDAKVWGDCSTWLTWLLPPLKELFPQAKFVHLIRDGRKVTSSYFHKLPECYDAHGLEILRQWYQSSGDEPPPEKRYWWLIPPESDGVDAEDWWNWSRLEKIAFYWACVNSVAMTQVEDTDHCHVKLEDLVSSDDECERLSDFLELPLDRSSLTRPYNVIRPQDVPLTKAQTVMFERVAGKMMDVLDYEGEEYRVSYAADRPVSVSVH